MCITRHLFGRNNFENIITAANPEEDNNLIVMNYLKNILIHNYKLQLMSEDEISDYLDGHLSSFYSENVIISTEQSLQINSKTLVQSGK